MTTELPKTKATEKPRWRVNRTFKDCVEMAAWTVAVLAAVGGVIQYRAEHRWKQAELARTILEKLIGNPKARSAMYMLDWGKRDYDVGPGKVEIISSDVENALRTENTKDFGDKGVFIRDCFDDLFDGFELIEHYIEIGLIHFEDVEAPLRYYVEALNNRRDIIGNFLQKYGFTLTQKFLKRFPKEWPPTNAEVFSARLILVVEAISTLTLLLITYVVLAGPVMWLIAHGYLPKWLASIYSPVWTLPVVGDFIQWTIRRLPP